MSLLARLIEAGTPPELIEEVAMLLAEKRVLETRRKNERERKQAQRQKEADCHVTSRDSTGQTGTPQTQPDTSFKSIPPVSPKGDTAPQGAKRNKGTRIPADWKPLPPAELSPEACKLAQQWPASTYRAEAEAFVNYWTGESGAKACKSNWNTAWANRVVQIHSKVMRDAKFSTGPPGETSSFFETYRTKQAVGN